MAKNSGKTLKIKARLAFLNIRYEGLSNQDRIKKLREVTENNTWPVYLAKEKKMEEFEKFLRTFREGVRKEERAKHQRARERREAYSVERQQKAEEISKKEGELAKQRRREDKRAA